MTRRAAVVAAALYLAAAVLMTWPLATVLTHEIAWDMGDPVFNSWVLMWTGGQVLAFLGGDWSALSRYWHGNIFYPERLTIAYSEHLAPQMLQALPILAATDNVVLAYNLLFISTFVLCGLGTFLLVRELTGSPGAAFVAGLAFAFAPYRMAQLPHLQVLSVQWMPLVLYAYRRHFQTGRIKPLVWGSVAFVIQNLSCGYYLLFFAPFVVAYVLYEMAARQQLLDWRAWRRWAIAGVLVLLFTFPFLRPYLDVREGGDVGVRHADEIAMFSADTHAFATPAPHLWLWGQRLDGFYRPEGEGFSGFTILLLALTAVTTAAATAWRTRSHIDAPPAVPWRQVALGAVGVLLVAHLVACAIYLLTGRLPIPYDGTWAVYQQADGTLVRTLILGALWIALSPGTRRFAHANRGSLVAFFAIAAVAAALFALGPKISVTGQVIGTGPYAWLVAYVPGFDGVRVPARFLMLVALFLSVLAGYGIAATVRRWPRAAPAVVAIGAGLILLEAWPGPFQTNVRLAAEGLLPTPRELKTGDHLSPIYQYVRDQQDPLVLVEFPFGAPAWDLHSTFYAGYHRRPLVNGYSGFFPKTQHHNNNVFAIVRQYPDAAWRGLIATRATHAIVHENAFIPSRRGVYSEWLLSQGATEIMTDGPMRLFRIR